MNNKKIKSLIIVAVFLILSFSLVYGEESQNDIYNEGVKSINNYEMESGLKNMRKIITDPQASDELKTKAFFWIAFIHLSEGREKDTRKIIMMMLDQGLGVDYTVEDIPERLAQNVRLVRIFEREKIEFLKQKGALPKDAEKYYNKAFDLYKDRNISKANEFIEMCLKIAPDHNRAVELKNKIKETKKRRIESQRNLVEEFYREAVYSFNNENYLETMHYTNDIFKLNPKHQKARNLFRKAYNEIQRIIKDVSERDKEKFNKAVNYYLDKEFDVAAKVFRQLREYSIPKADEFFNFSISHIIKEENKKRANKLFKQALRAMKNSRYFLAREKALNALVLNKYCLDARILLQEVRLEIDSD
ncbi:MAG: hypothetical protein ACOC5R_05205 [Elusimicrobiota bacterium]